MLLKETALVNVLGLTQIPLILYCTPRVESYDANGCEIRIPLSWRTKNHWGSMYFGALAVGADLSGGFMAFRLIREEFPKVNLLFKDFKANFLKRADGDVHFRCTQGQEIRRAVEEADRSGERVHLPLKIIATVPSKHGDEPVCEFELGLSLKRK